MRFKAEVARAAMLFDARKKTQATSKRERSTLNAGLVSLERSDILHILMDPLLMARNCAWWNKTLQGLQAVESESCPEITYLCFSQQCLHRSWFQISPPKPRSDGRLRDSTLSDPIATFQAALPCRCVPCSRGRPNWALSRIRNITLPLPPKECHLDMILMRFSFPSAFLLSKRRARPFCVACVPSNKSLVMSRIALFVAALVAGCSAAVYQNINAAPRINYDFIIVGGGTAGSVLARRLSENHRHQVLLIESGPSHEGVLNIQVPSNVGLLFRTEYDWNFTTTPQTALNGRVLDYNRGHVLGGSSSINGMYWTKGSAEDYDRWASVTGDPGWSWNNLFQYTLKMESLVPPADGHDTTGQVDPSVHGTSGNVKISLPGHPLEIDPLVMAAAAELGGEFTPIVDMNSGSPLGTGWTQSTIGNGERSSAATAYLESDCLRRRNLHVVVNTRVTRVLQTRGGPGRAFRTVEIATQKNPNAPRIQLTAKKEVILSAGAIGTPHILLNSGFGNPSELAALGIRPAVNLPGVGKNLTDHPFTYVAWEVNSTSTRDVLTLDPNAAAQAFGQWFATRTGPLTILGTNQMSWLRIPDNSSIWGQFPDPSSGSNTPHFELNFDNSAGFTGAQGGYYTSAGITISTPWSRGSVTLQSSNPFDQPNIDPGLFTSAFDEQAMLHAIRTLRRFFQANAWNGYILQPAGAWTDAIMDNDEAAIALLKATVIHAWHACGTTVMSPKRAKYGVVDPDLTVKNVQGLRIVDAGVMPFIPAAHTQFAVYVIAERAADLIKAKW